jgi:hypothetical protein
VVTGKEVATAARGRVDRLALAPDNRRLVTADETSLRVWDLATGNEAGRWGLPVPRADYHGEPFVNRLLMLPGGRRVFTALADGTGLVWDLAPFLGSGGSKAGELGEKELTAAWEDLAGDARRAFAAVWRLAEAPTDAVVPFLRRHLKPVAPPDSAAVRRHIADLDSDSFAAREKAYKQLESLGVLATPALREALAKAPPTEVRRRLEKLLARPPAVAPSPRVLRRLRAIQVLERLGSDDARRLLADLAAGAAHAPETEEAAAALGRLSRPPAVP